VGDRRIVVMPRDATDRARMPDDYGAADRGRLLFRPASLYGRCP